MLPEIFGSVHHETFRKWSDSPKCVGRLRVEWPIMVSQIGGTIALDLCRQDVPFTVEISRRILQEQRGVLVSGLFLHAHGLSLKSASSVSAKRSLTQAEARMHRQRLQCKLVWLQRECDILACRVWNFDETGICLLPWYPRSWSPKAGSKYRLDDEQVWRAEKQQFTLSLAIPRG